MKNIKVLISMILTSAILISALTACAEKTAQTAELSSNISSYLPELPESLTGGSSENSTQSSSISSTGSSSASSVQSSLVSSTTTSSISSIGSSSENSAQSSSEGSFTSSSSSQSASSNNVSTSSAESSSSSAPEADHPPFSTLLYNMSDNFLISSENANEHIAPASLLKLLTASVALRYLSVDEIVDVGTELTLVPPNSSLAFLMQGHRLSMYDLLTGMLLASGNDAAYTVAVTTAREVSGEELSDIDAVRYFADMMNEFANELGMSDSYFVNPDGSDDDRQYTTANDLLLLARYALTVPEIREITSTHQRYVVFESGHNITWTNSNKLLDPEGKYYCPDAIGLKTGTTYDAGFNLIAAFDKGGKTYIAIAAGCKSDAERYKLMTDYYSRI